MINNITLGTMADQQITKPAVSPGQAQESFANTLKAAINNVNNSQIASDKKTEALANGQIDDLHDVMITAQKASITLETSVQMQRKAIDAYNEIMRMQV
ncbi:Flagellar hook-basal body complex protein FliE [Oceanobacillus picturae]|jgi:flagellar hook-basal body complex protein FliE|uniref:Flagellar hook-basal body complex protein FliE n=1 Tax=Oceanobacillus picturae TaxID=171693 RepID=W9A9T5_9BACI|nr:flagellar hook-basal body complex protein FliE [Oceanobacillus picturae]RIU96372.1 flagellar hook-basal body complex protein FliE [Oceanobacillus picturae]CDO02238.1 Flagellar hook-basal body complex protein FliE [Oceanobacillus picturae]